MLQLFLDPLILMALLWLVARDNADLEFSTLFFVALGIGLGSAIVGNILDPVLGAFSVVPAMAVAVFILMKFCSTTLKQSLIVVILLGIWHIAFSLALTAMTTT